MCKVSSICNQKGGVGKTTTAINLGVALANEGKRVLAIDLDPQANLTMALGYDQPDELETTIASLISNEINDRNSVRSDSGSGKEDYILSAHGVDFIPSSIELAGIENLLINTMSRENVLKKLLGKHKDNYDYILIDCLPSLNVLTVNALTASNDVIIPVQAQYLSAKGLELLLGTISNVKANLNPKLNIAGVLITMLDTRGNFQKEVVNTISESYGRYIRIFDSHIPTSVKVSENQSKGAAIIGEKNNKVAQGYESLAKELMKNE